MKKSRIAIFDVDKTLIIDDILLVAAKKSKKGISRIKAWMAFFPWLIFWLLKLTSTKVLKEKFLKIFCICSKFNKEGENFIFKDLINSIRPEAINRLKWHKKRGDRVILCSASPRLLLEPLANYLKVELICTELKKNNENWIPKLDSLNIKGPNKLKALKNHIPNLDDFEIEVYGDSDGDKELLRYSDFPHYRSFDDNLKPYPKFSLKKLLPLIGLTLFLYGFINFVIQGEDLLPLILFLLPEITFGLFLVFIGYFIRFIRWHGFLKILGFNPPLYEDAKIWMSSFAFTATPGKSGEIVRSFLLKEEFGIPLEPTLVALLMERFTDMLSVLFLIILNLNFLFNLSKEIIWLLLIFFISISFFYICSKNKIINKILFSFFRKIFPRNIFKTYEKSSNYISEIFTFQNIFYGILLGSISWSFEGISFWIILNKMGQYQVDLFYSIVTHTASGLFGALTMLPGGLGTTEASMIGLLGVKGVEINLASPLTLIIRLMTLWFATLLGVLILFLNKKKS